MPLVDYTIIRVSLPLEGHDQPDLLNQVVALLGKSQPIGCVGNYIGVYELEDGLEGFLPVAGAAPTKGKIGETETCKAKILTTYAPADVPETTIENFVEDLAQLHPWEHPVIEITNGHSTRIWMPGT